MILVTLEPLIAEVAVPSSYNVALLADTSKDTVKMTVVITTTSESEL